MHVNGVSIIPSSVTGEIFPPVAGLFLAVLDEGTATLKSFRIFDIWASDEVNELLQIYIHGIRQGRVLLVAGMDMVGSKIDSNSRIAFKKMGSAFVDYINVKHSWAMISQVGLEHGTIMEEMKAPEEGPTIVTASVAFNLNIEYHLR